MGSPDGLILLDPFPRRLDRIFDAPTRARLERLGRVLWHDGSPAPASHLDAHLPDAVALKRHERALPPRVQTQAVE